MTSETKESSNLVKAILVHATNGAFRIFEVFTSKRFLLIPPTHRFLFIIIFGFVAKKFASSLVLINNFVIEVVPNTASFKIIILVYKIFNSGFAIIFKFAIFEEKLLTAPPLSKAFSEALSLVVDG
jgi:hypothetical protein